MASAIRNSSVGMGQEDIAIVGMACIFPGADSLAQYWQNLVGHADCVTDPPAARIAHG